MGASFIVMCALDTRAYPLRRPAQVEAPQGGGPPYKSAGDDYEVARYLSRESDPNKSFHSGLSPSMAAIFQARGQCFIVFSR